MENAGRSAPSQVNASLTWRVWFCYGIGHVLNDICAALWFTYLLVFFHLVLKFDTLNSGIILLVGQIVDAVSTTFVGIESDKNISGWLCKYGRRKTWHLFGTVFILCSFPFIFTPCVGCENTHEYAQMVYYCSFVVIFQFGWAAVQISHLALIPELTSIDSQRTQLASIRYAFSVLSTVIIYIITWVALKSDAGNDDSLQIGPKDAIKFQKVVYSGLLIGLVTSIIFHWGIKEKFLSKWQEEKEKKNKSVCQFMKEFTFYQVAICYMCSRLFVNLVQIYIPLYLHESLSKNAENLAAIPLLIYLGSIFATTSVNYLNKIFGRKISYGLGSIIGIIACIWIKIGNHYTFEIYLIAILLGICGSILIVSALGLTADLIGNNTGRGAFIYGAMSFGDKLSNGIAVIIIQYEKCLICRDYYQNILVFVCGGAVVIGLLPLFSLKFSTKKDLTNLGQEEEEKSLLRQHSLDS